MLIFEEEIRYISPLYHRVITKDCITYLWQHSLHEEAINDFVHLHFPLLDTSIIKASCRKRYMEQLSIRILLSQLVGQAARIAYKPTGRPYLQGSDWQISVSHSYNIYALSFAHKQHGIDIERWGNKAYRVRSKYLTAEEERLFNQIPNLQTIERTATMLWSAKESVYKAFDIPHLEMKNGILLTFLQNSRGLLASLPQYGLQGQIFYQIYPDCIQTACFPILHIS